MKQLIVPKALALAILLTVMTSIGSTTAALGKESGSATPTMDRILKSGTLRVGLTAKQPPLNMKDKSGQIIGMDVDLADALALSMGVEAEFVVMDFTDLLPAVQSGKVDIVLSGLTMTSERNTRVAFAGPYFISGKGLLTSSAALAKIDKPADLDGSNAKLVALEDSTSYRFIQDAAPNATAIAAKDYDEAIQMVIDGKADAMVADYPICVVALFQHPGIGLQSVKAPFTFEPMGAALPANDPLFINLVQNYMNMLEHTGLMKVLRTKWFDSGGWLAIMP